MKKDIHPKYNSEAKVICACGNEFVTGSVMNEIKTELCSACHPFFTGKQKLVDSARRVEKFNTKVKMQSEIAKDKKGKTAKRAAKALASKAKTESTAEAKIKKTTDKK